MTMTMTTTSEVVGINPLVSKWIIVEQNKWGLKISETNYMFVIINPLEDGKYELKYMDANLKDYTNVEKREVRRNYGISTQANRELALKIMEHYGHYEWIEILPSKQALCNILTDATSFDLNKLRQLVEYNELHNIEDGLEVNFNLWARAGITIKLTKEDIPKFLNNKEKFIREGLDNGKVVFDGETYFPEEIEVNEEFAKIYGQI